MTDDDLHIKVPALDQEYVQKLSLWKHHIVIRVARHEEQTVDRAVLARARRKIEAIFKSGADRRRKGRWNTQGKPSRNLSEQVKDESHNTLSQCNGVSSVPDEIQQLMSENEQSANTWKTINMKQEED